jgi:CAF1 family ribonuclease.
MDITRDNFEDKFKEIETSLQECVFIAVDNEFTGLLSDSDWKPR